MLDFTGERFIPAEGGEIRYEHMHRYCWAQSLCIGRAVLDIACGEGYGSALLAQVAQSVIGVDISQDTIDHAIDNYSGRSNLRFTQGTATQIPIDDASVDVVVSFETLEHLGEHEEMVTELRRVLKPTGILVISSPNKKVYSDDRRYINQFHVKELYFIELTNLLSRHFGAARYFGQRFLTASALLPIGAPAAEYGAICMEHDKSRELTFVSDENMYFVAVCAATDDLLPDIKPNLFVDTSNDLYNEQQKLQRWAAQLDNEYSDLSKKHLKLQSEFDGRSVWALQLRAELTTERSQRTLERKAFESELLETQRKVEDSEMELAALKILYTEVRQRLDKETRGANAFFRWIQRLLQ